MSKSIPLVLVMLLVLILGGAGYWYMHTTVSKQVSTDTLHATTTDAVVPQKTVTTKDTGYSTKEAENAVLSVVQKGQFFNNSSEKCISLDITHQTQDVMTFVASNVASPECGVTGGGARYSLAPIDVYLHSRTIIGKELGVLLLNGKDVGQVYDEYRKEAQKQDTQVLIASTLALGRQVLASPVYDDKTADKMAKLNAGYSVVTIDRNVTDNADIHKLGDALVTKYGSCWGIGDGSCGE